MAPTYAEHLTVSYGLQSLQLSPPVTGSFTVPVYLTQVIKGFCDKADGKDKLTALIQVHLGDLPSLHRHICRYFSPLILPNFCSMPACSSQPVSQATLKRSRRL